jgi:fused signal recognition particle receptor
VLLRRPAVSDETFEELEELLVASDVSVKTATGLIERVRGQARGERADGERVQKILEEHVVAILSHNARPLVLDGEPPLLYMIVGVNGTGKTTTIAKLAHHLRAHNRRCLLAAADTFRAAAVEQLELWAGRVNVPIVRHQMGGDPAAVVFDALTSARARGIDCVIADTAGRLHTKRNLMEELRKIGRVAERELHRPPDEVLLVIDATTGQNALVQAREFADAVRLSGVVLTKLDGTAKGGTVITIADETDLPIKFIGTGERLEDLAPFDPATFVKQLFEEDE